MHLILAVAIPILGAWQDECRHSAPHEASLDIAGSSSVTVTAGAGSLRVEGKSGLRQARIRAMACASSRELLEEIRFDAIRSGSEIQVRANDEELPLRNREYARLDVVIEVPEGFGARVHDGSGHIELYSLGNIEVEDGSGEVTVRAASGNVVINDGAGDIDVRGAGGNVLIEDGSGNMVVHDVTGAVDVTDASGGIRITKVNGSVLVRDGSGDIVVNDVEGSFTVRGDAAGDIMHRAVRGGVNLPADRDYDRGRKWSRFRLF